MVDVWSELGKALGRALKPLAEIPAAIWKSLGDAAGGLIDGFMKGAGQVSKAVEPTIESLMPNIFDEATKALGEGSPPTEIKEAVDKFIEQLMKTIAKESKTKGHSLPTGTELMIAQAKVIGGVMEMYIATHIISMALDATQPLKDWGFKSAAMDIMYQFDMGEMVGPMIQAPIWASIITPLRMRSRFDNPYEIPASGTLPYLRAKKLITPEAYEENMQYWALDKTWSGHMLANTWRYPDFGDMRTMIHRGAATWVDARAALEKNLVATEYIDAYEKLLPAIPGSGDLITMMVREVIEKQDFIDNMRLQGFSAEWSEAYYDNHWILLPLGEVKKARYRGDIDDEELAKFLVLHDYRPTPRPGIKTSDGEIAAGLIWDRPGRIDARWLFRWGEIDVTGLRDLLVDDGLDPAYANAVATATAKNQYMSDINREIANIKADYARGYSVEATLRRDLGIIGLRSEMVEYHVADALADRVRSIKDEELRTLRVQYARGAMTMADIVAAAEGILVDKEVRDAWVEALPTAKQVMIVEETFTTEVNRLVANAKYDYVRGYVEKPAMVSRLQLLALPDQVIEYHVLDADEDRQRQRNDDRLVVIKDMWMKDVETDFAKIEGWVKPIIVDEEARELWLSDAWFDKFKTVTR